MIQKENLFVELLNLAEEIQESPDGILAIVYQILVDENLKALLHPFCRESRIPVPAPEYFFTLNFQRDLLTDEERTKVRECI